MAFINEYISDEDMKKYKIIEIWREFYPERRHSDWFPRRKFSWTVDKARNIFFIPMRSGREEESNQQLCALWWDGVLLSVTIASVGGTVNYLEMVGSCVWDLLDIWRPNGFMLSNEEIIPILKEILIVYQDSGILTPMKEYQVTFNF